MVYRHFQSLGRMLANIGIQTQLGRPSIDGSDMLPSEKCRMAAAAKIGREDDRKLRVSKISRFQLLHHRRIQDRMVSGYKKPTILRGRTQALFQPAQPLFDGASHPRR